MGDKTYPLDDIFSKEQTVTVNVVNTNLRKPESVIDEIERRCGTGSVLACVPKFGTSYEVVMQERRYVGEISGDHLSLQGKTCPVNELISVFKIVSIINLSMYVTDEEIIDRFGKMGVEIVSDIKKRKMHSRLTIYDGTRVFKAKLPPTLASIPYSMKFSVNGRETAYYRVIHNNQVKVCSSCFSPTHLYKDCPDFKCFECGLQGHIVKNCPEYKCKVCSRLKSECECTKEKRYFGEGFDRNPGKRKSHWLGNPNVEHSEEDKKCKVSDQSENDKVDDMKDKGNNSEPSQTVQSPVEDTSLITTEALVIQKQQMCYDVESNDGNNGEDDVNDGNNGDDDDGDTDVDDVMNGNVSATVAKSENGVQIKNANAKTDEDCEQIYEELELTVSKCNDLLVINENVVTSEGILSENCNIDEDVSIISSLEQTCSQGEDEGAYGELEEIDMDTVSLTDNSQGRC
ncbi:unnamed protein product [Mytilus coruscus]|uniref:CCHC-type domain-containing protein n=1 Tax=Mytilus coruscus TaxID=42192 RepID=A0A6J8EUP3_MYTCO|nr:unnamed protein product [Mytilus coruscus]